MSIGSIESANGSGNGLLVGDDGEILVRGADVIEVDAARPASAAATEVTVGTSSGTLVGGNSDRIGLVIQNLGAFPVHVNLVGGTATATNGLRIDPGATFQLPCGVRLSGTVTAIAVGGSSAVIVYEFNAV